MPDLTPAATPATVPCPGCRRPVVPYASNFATLDGRRYRTALCRCGCGRTFHVRTPQPAAPTFTAPTVTVRE